MKKLTMGALACSLALTSFTGHAEGKWSLGAAALFAPNPYKEVNTKVYPVPMFGYESDTFYLHGLSAGYYLWNDESNKLSIMTYYSPLALKPGDSDNQQVKRVNKRRATMMGGFSYQHFTQWGFLRTVLAGDYLNNSNGIIWDTAWLYRYQSGSFTVTPGLGVTWNSKNQNRYYYGINGDESRRSMLNQYRPDDSWSPYAEVTLSYALNNSLSLFGAARYTRLNNEIHDSPLVDRHDSQSYLVGMSYRF